MKKITLLFAFLFSVICIGQSSDLTDRTWRCTNLVINGENIVAPYNYEVVNVTLDMLQDGNPSTADFLTSVCNGLSTGDGEVVYNDAEITFTLSGLTQTLINCNEGENSFFESNYFGFFYDSQETPLSYEIIELDDDVMTITAPNGDTAHYQEGLLELEGIDLLDGSETLWTLTRMTIDDINLPAPISEEINPILARFYFDVDIFAMENSACGSILFASPYSEGENNIGFSGIEGGDSTQCTISENQEYAATYFDFFEEGVAYEYSTMETGAGTFLAIIHPNGDIAFYNRKNLSVAENSLQFTTVYPNPAITSIIIDARTAVINQVEIYSISGQLLESVKGLISSIDVSSLSRGTYFLKVYSDSTFIFKQFVKR